MAAPDAILQLIDRFETHKEAYRSAQYNETQLRREFLDPFFEALGWDVNNKQGYAEAYKDVVHEDAIKIGGATKAPDYCFRVGGTRKFFLEAKKPSVNLKDDISAAFQLRRYAWSAHLPLSILSDFDEFAVYDCRIKPDKNDKASAARILYLPYSDFSTRWEDIASVFSREAILKGSFDKYAESAKGKKGTAEVDDAFLKEIEAWRDSLARNLALRNPALTSRELNHAVQTTIDRLIFLRICEDRGIEEYGRLMALQNGNSVYERLCILFRQADDRYNSGLFHFKNEKNQADLPDEITLLLTIDDKPLKDIIKSLYYPDSPYEFSVLPADILGQVYEQFLGKVIRLNAGHRAIVEHKPEVKKAGGVFYTPTYIVEYIVMNTVGKLVEEMNPQQVAKLRVLDPACGSGSFLIGAYQFLLDWHRDWYVADGPEKWIVGKSPRLYQRIGNEWRLTTAERRRILLNNIHGVDIDPQAVEVTKLSLLLKVLEGENQQTLNKQLAMFHERALPNLGNNIKCGNSLVGPDYYDNQQMSFLDEEERYRINVFDWNAEFPEIMKTGGFDAVIGNPPYVRQEELGNEKRYLESHYKTFRPTSDLYVNFIEKGLSLLKSNGLFGMIVSNKWLRAAYGRPLRQYLTQVATVLEIVDLAGLPVFSNATVRTVILVCSPGVGKNDHVCYLAPIQLEEFLSINTGKDLQQFVDKLSLILPVSSLSPDGWSLSSAAVLEIIQHLKRDAMPLMKYVGGKLFRGVVTGMNEAFIIDKATRDRLVAQDPKSNDIIKPLLAGRDIRRYCTTEAQRYLVFTRRGIDISKYPAIEDYLGYYRRELTPKRDPRERVGRKPGRYEWFEIQDTIDYYLEFGQPKIIYPDIATSCRFSLDMNGYFGSNTTYFIPCHDLYLLGILNSKLAQFYFSRICAGLEGTNSVYLRFFGQYIENFPVHVNDSETKRSADHDQLANLVRNMIELQEHIATLRVNHQKDAGQRQIDAVDRQIDQLVYELYGLTEEEIVIVEESVH